MPTWNLKSFCDRFEQLHGQNEAARLTAAVQSYAWKKGIADYHISAVNRMLAATGSRDGQTSAESFEPFLIPQAHPDQQVRDTRSYQFESQAHLIAGAQALHSMHDIANHLIYRYLRLHLIEPLNDCEMKWRRFSALLRRANQNAILDSLVSHRGTVSFLYLGDFVNTTKHNMHIFASRRIDLVNNRGGFFLNEFRYDTRHHREKYFEEFINELEQIYVSLSAILMRLEQ